MSTLNDKRIILVEEPTAFERKRSTALWKLVDFFIARSTGKVGDILLTNECRLHGLIEDYTDEYFVSKEAK